MLCCRVLDEMQIHSFEWYPLPLLSYVNVAHTRRNPYGYRPPPVTLPNSISPFQAFAACSKYYYTISKKPNSSKDDSSCTSFNDDICDVDLPDEDEDEDEDDFDFSEIEIDIEKTDKNRRRIRSKVSVEASLQSVWTILTDYERLADFIPGLAVSQVLDKRDNFARLFQIGEQNLPFGLKFNAKGVVDCYEKETESLPFGQRRDIEFKMIEGDFELFEGNWSIEQISTGRCEQSGSLVRQEFRTTLSYVVDVEPKMWLPVQLVEGRLCREIKMNLSCIRKEAQKAVRNTLPTD